MYHWLAWNALGNGLKTGLGVGVWNGLTTEGWLWKWGWGGARGDPHSGMGTTHTLYTHTL